ncbi:MAG: hypothetical protein ACTSRC_13520 [Candidatus Helarchaeota archaeon]
MHCPKCKEANFIAKGEGYCPFCEAQRKKFVCLECTTTFFECGHSLGFQLNSSCPSDIFRNIKH